MTGVNSGFRVQYTAEQLMERVTKVRDKVQRNEENTGEYTLNRLVANWVTERVIGSSPRTERYASALMTTTLYAPFASALYHEAFFELRSLLEEVERSA